MKALALFSGGLDSLLAIELIKKQRIEVIGLNFVSYFFGGKNSKVEEIAKKAGIEIEYIDFKEAHAKMLKDPPSGYGKNMNPCIDCHALMMSTAKDLLDKYEASFIITGEVLGQRPMSQTSSALKRIEKLSGCKGLIVRPLSGQALPATIPEESGWIDREKLMNIQGRGRKKQIALAKDYGIEDYPSPGGGCLLTMPNYSRRLEVLKNDDQFENGILFEMIKVGRFYRVSSGKYLFVGRHEEENDRLLVLQKDDSLGFYIKGYEIPGPVIVGHGDFSEDELHFVKELFSRYSQAKGKEKCNMLFNGEIVSIDEVDSEKLNEKIEEYQVL